MKRTLLAILLLLPVPAMAEFTTAENAQVLAQVEALYDSGRAYTWAADQLSTRPQDAAQIATLFNQITTAHEWHMRGLLYLLDQDGGDGVTIDAMTRPQAVAAAFSVITGSLASYAPAIATIDSVPVSSGLATARQLLNSAEAKRLAIDQTLLYVEPRVAENVARSGATREQSANAGPHGDYRRYGELVKTFDIQSGRWIRAAARAGSENTAFIPSLQFLAAKMNRVQAFTAVIAGLVVGVEHPEFVAGIDTMFAGGTTNRSRHFFRIQLADELLLGWDYGVESHPFRFDVFGREVVRGLTYELTAACREMSDFALEDAGLPAYVKSILEADREICESWSSLDGIAQNTLVFRYFTNVGSPSQVHGICGTGTILQPGPPPTCVSTGGGSGFTCGSGTHIEGTECVADPCPECPPQVTCGTGTHLVGTTCEADPQPQCPTFHAELTFVNESDRVEYRALCVQNP